MSEPTDEIAPAESPSTLAIAVGFVLIYLSWGTTYFATGYAMQQERMPPALFSGIRLLLAGAILVFYQACRGESLRLTVADFLRLVPVSVALFLIGNLTITIAQKHVESGVAAILIATTPLFIGFLGVFWPHGDRLSWRGWLGLAIGFIGTVITLVPKVQNSITWNQSAPYGLVLASALSWAAGSHLSRNLSVKIPHLTSAAYQMLIGGVGQVSVGSAVGEWPALVERASLLALAAFVYLLIAGSLIGFVTFNWLLVHVPAAKVGTYAYVNPVIAVFIGAIMNETRVTSSLMVGISVIFLGVYLVKGDRHPTREIELEPD